MLLVAVVILNGMIPKLTNVLPQSDLLLVLSDVLLSSCACAFIRVCHPSAIHTATGPTLRSTMDSTPGTAVMRSRGWGLDGVIGAMINLFGRLRIKMACQAP